MLQFMFGETALTAWRSASQRLRLWAQAFQDWLDERQRTRSLRTFERSRLAWKRLLSHVRKPPFELSLPDLQAYMRWMEDQGLAQRTIRGDIYHLSIFFAWCLQRRLDPQCPPDFNPAARVKTPPRGHFPTHKVLTPQEAADLLALLARDQSILGLRDHAFFLARLNLGFKLKLLCTLQWGQVDPHGQQASVRWAPDEEPQPLPDGLWPAILRYLEASGRLPGMTPHSYLFTPVKDSHSTRASGSAQDWNENNYLSTLQAYRSLRLYGRLVGIPDEKLTMDSLRYTAIALHLPPDASSERIQAFTRARTEIDIRRFLHDLPPAYAHRDPQALAQAARQRVQDLPLPPRRPHRWELWERMTHGRRVLEPPPEDLAWIMQEDPQGLKGEIIGLRKLEERLAAIEKETPSRVKRRKLRGARTMAAFRVKTMLEAEKRQNKISRESRGVDKFLEAMDRINIREGKAPSSEQFRQEVLGSGSGLDLDSKSVGREIYIVRIAIRNCYQDAITCQDPDELVSLVEEYCIACSRLMRLLSGKKDETELLNQAIHDLIERAIREAGEELGIS